MSKSQTTRPTYVDRLDLHEGPVETNHEPLNRKFSGKLNKTTAMVDRVTLGIIAPKYLAMREALERLISQIDEPKNAHHTLGAFRLGVAMDMARAAYEAALGESE